MFNVLLQILDNGRLTDAKGRVVNFKNTIIIMTSNVGSEFLQEMARIGFATEVEASHDREETDLRDKIKKALERSFRPEFLNRIDEIIIFNSLSRAILERIVAIQLDKMRERTAKKGIEVSFAPELHTFLVEKGFDPHYGARPLKRAIQTYVLNGLAQEVIAGKIREGDRVLVGVKDGAAVFQKPVRAPKEREEVATAKR